MRNLLVLIILFILPNSIFGQAWIQRTNFGGAGRHRTSSFAIGNRGYIGCGHVNGLSGVINYADWWEYDPASDSWTQKANYPTVNYGAISFAAAGKGYVGGGAFLGSEFYSFNPVTNTWTAIQNCPGSPGDQGCFAVGDKGYVFVGAAVYEYNAITGNWTTKQNGPAFGGWCVAFSIGTSGYVKNGAVLYEYKPLYDQWLVRAAFPGMNTNGGAALARNGKGYIISGFVGSLNIVTPEVWEYNPGNNTWLRLNDFPGTDRRFSTAFCINGKGYFGTGTNGLNFNDFWEMNDGVGIDELDAKSEVVVYPQPATEYVNISLKNYTMGTDATLRLFNTQGQCIQTISPQANVFLVERQSLAAGIYLFEIVVDGVVIGKDKLIFR